MPPEATLTETPVERAQRAYDEAVTAMHGLADAADAAEGAEARAAAHAEFEESRGAVDAAKAELDRCEAIQRSREAHPAPELVDVDVTRTARARGAAAEEMTYRPTQRNNWEGNQGYFHDLAMAQTGDQKARERLFRNNRQAIDSILNDSKLAEWERQERAGDLTTATHMGEFVKPDWSNELFAFVARAGRPFADQCLNLGEPTTTSWNLPRITTGATAAVQTEGSALGNTDQVSDSINAILQTVGGYSLASYQLVELAEPGMDQILFADLEGALNLAIDQSLLSQATTGAKGLFDLASINSVSWTQTTPSLTGLWPTIFQAKSKIETNVPGSAVHFILMHAVLWNWILAQVDSTSRPLFTSTDLPAFNNLGTFNGAAQGVAGNIDGIPVILDQSITLLDGAGTNQTKIALVDRQALLKKEGAPRTLANPITQSTSLMWTFQSYAYLSRMFGRWPKKISAITGTGLIVPTGYTG